MIDPVPVSPDTKRYEFHVSMILSGPGGVAVGASSVFTFYGSTPPPGGFHEMVEFTAKKAEEAIDQAADKGITI